MELKTLKDLKLGWENYDPEDENIRKQLRAEAVKWVKEMEGKTFANWRRLFSKFFNITEKDLNGLEEDC